MSDFEREKTKVALSSHLGVHWIQPSPVEALLLLELKKHQLQDLAMSEVWVQTLLPALSVPVIEPSAATTIL
jgi:hypothetical protein